MFKNYWYLIALGAVFSIMTHLLHNIWIACLFLVWMLYLFHQRRCTWYVLFASIASFTFFYFYIPSINIPQQIDAKEFNTTSTIQGKIISSIQMKESSLEFTFQNKKNHEHILVTYFFTPADLDKTQVSPLKYGATCTITGKLSLPSNARNPHQFDFQKYLWQKGITYQLFIEDLSDISCRNHNMLQFIYIIRDKLLDASSNKLQRETASWLQALLLGNRNLIDEEIIELFQRWSLSHILAISGLHIGIIVAIIYAILVRCSLTTKETAQTMLLMFLPVYALLAGGQPSVWRASLTVVLGILLVKWKIRLNYTDIISIVFLSLILIYPRIVYHVGFQFSFLVSFGLILSQQWIRQTKSNIIRLLQISFISQMVILPLQIHYFFTFQPLSILLNVIIVPYFSIFVIPMMFILLFTIYLPLPISNMIETIFLHVHDLILTFIALVDKYLNYPFVIGNFPIYFTFVYYLSFILLMQNLERNEYKKTIWYGIATCLVLIVLVVRPHISPVGKVTMLDIGQGDAYIIQLPYRQGVFMIDAGAKFSFTDFMPTNSVYKQVIRPYLLGEGIQKIDTVFISHADLDHNGSIPFLVRDFEVKEIVISNYYEITESENESWEQYNIDIERVAFNQQLNKNGLDFYTLSPQYDKLSENENSLVLFTEVGGARWLFTGDIDKQTEREIKQNYPNLNIDILKVSHHGSNTSTDPQFISDMKPTYALISAGIDNRFGHPTEEVLQTLIDNEVIIYRTDKHGAVQYIFRDNKGFFRTQLSDAE